MMWQPYLFYIDSNSRSKSPFQNSQKYTKKAANSLLAASLFDPQFFLSKTTFFHILVLSLQHKKTFYARNKSFLRYYHKDVLQAKRTGPAHIHAIYNENVGIFDIKTFEMTEGDLPIKAQQLVKEWLGLHYKELIKMWDSQKIEKINPL